MAEQTLNNPLSGAEIRQAVLDHIDQALQKDCYLNPNSAYDWFTAKIKIELDMHDSGSMVKGDYTVSVAKGKQPDADTDHVEAELEIEAAPPNEVRVQTGQPVPTLTKDASGNLVEKGVRYARKTVRPGAKK